MPTDVVTDYFAVTLTLVRMEEKETNELEESKEAFQKEQQKFEELSSEYGSVYIKRKCECKLHRTGTSRLWKYWGR